MVGIDKLPAVPSAQVDEIPLEGEIIAAEPAPRVYDLHVIARSAAAIAAHPHARRAGRHAGYIAAGVIVASRRRRKRRTLTSEMAHLAAARGEFDKAKEWAELDHQHRHQRAERRRKAWETAGHILRDLPHIMKGTAIVSAVAGVLLLVTGNAAVIGGLVRTVAAVLAFCAHAMELAWQDRLWLIGGAGLVLLARFWHIGRTAGEAPQWARTSADADADPVIDERAITQALKQLRIPQITDYLKLDQPMAYLVPCRQEGRGTYAEIRLPGGLPAGEIAKAARRERLAAGLYRHTKEVWPTVGADNSHLKLWIADKGALEEGAGPYPLLEDGFTDVFKGVPFGRTLRGDPVMAPLMERNTITGGMPGQGKSSAARVLMCGAALDPSAELWIMIPDVNFDFEVMKRRCSRYVMGAEDERVEQIRDWLSDLRDEVQRRGQKLVDYEVPAVTRKLASAGVGLHPLFVLLEEAHVAIQHGIYGKEIAGLLVDVVKLGRKRGIHVIVSTQAPTKDSLPRDVTRNCSNGIAFAVGDHVPNDALLGAGAYRAGHRATELIPGTDRGIAVVKGFTGERSEMVQVYFLDVERGQDQVTPIVDRAMAEVDRRGGVPGSPPPLTAIESRNLLDDLAEVLDGDDRVRLADIPPRLRKLAPSWLPYRALTGVQLRERLAAEEVKTTNPGNVPTLDPADLRQAIAQREVS